MAKAAAVSKNSPSKKTPAKKGTPAKPVKRLGADKSEKPLVEARKSAKNATKKEDVTNTSPEDLKDQVIAKAAKKVKVTHARKVGKKTQETPVKEKNESLDDSNADESAAAEDSKPDPVSAQESVSNGQDASGAKIAKVSIEHCKS
jgi:hypothetical protein